jgi:hypothetical protein
MRRRGDVGGRLERKERKRSTCVLQDAFYADKRIFTFKMSFVSDLDKALF